MCKITLIRYYKCKVREVNGLEKESQMLERLVALEKEVSALRLEVRQLKQQSKLEPFEVATKKEAPTFVPPVKPVQKEVPIKEAPTIVETQKPVKPVQKKEKRSLEETFTRALPRIFMVILVLGVLWGLKLVSDYGFLSDSIKILAGFILSIGLCICAFLMEKKQKGSRVVALSLYGGTFIIGILTTAAGAILYDVLGLYVALLIALIFIVYGVVISFMKGNEALTVLVVLTSLLLPYLLEYMDFSSIIIGIFIVLLFTALQSVILKHLQHKALYIGLAFSILALCIESVFHTEQVRFFTFALVILYCVFLVSYLRLYRQESKLHASMLFSFSIVIQTAIRLMLSNHESTLSIILFIVLGILSLVTYIIYKRQHKILFDIVASLTVLTLLNLIAMLNISTASVLLLYLIVVFVGLLLALKHAIPFMKWINGGLFTIIGLIIVFFYEVQPFVSVQHLAKLIVIAFIVFLYRFLIQRQTNTSQKTHTILSIKNVFPIIIYSLVLVYTFKIDIAYMPNSYASYLMYSVILLFFALTLVLKPDYVGRILPFIASSVYVFTALILFISVWVNDETVITALIMRLFYIGVLWAILVDMWKKGVIYKNYSTFFSRHTEHLTIAAMILSIIVIFNMTNFMNYHELINWSSAVITNTVSIFIISCLSLYLASKRNDRSLKLTGIGLLFFGIVKMIFFDLSALDILIRSISFIIIGAIGLVVSNKLLGKEKKSE